MPTSQHPDRPTTPEQWAAFYERNAERVAAELARMRENAAPGTQT